jgi:hypothetical protein
VPERSRSQSPNLCNTQDHFPLCISMVAPSPSSPDELLSGMILRPPQAIMSLISESLLKMPQEALAMSSSQIKSPVKSLKASSQSQRCPVQPSHSREDPLPHSRSRRTHVTSVSHLRVKSPPRQVRDHQANSPPCPVAEGRCQAISSWAALVCLKSSDAAPQTFEYNSKATLPRSSSAIIMEQLSVQVKRKLTLANNGQGAKSANQMGTARASMSAPMHQAPARHKPWPHLQPDSVAGHRTTKSGQLCIKTSSHLHKLW